MRFISTPQPGGIGTKSGIDNSWRLSSKSVITEAPNEIFCSIKTSAVWFVSTTSKRLSKGSLLGLGYKISSSASKVCDSRSSTTAKSYIGRMVSRSTYGAGHPSGESGRAVASPSTSLGGSVAVGVWNTAGVKARVGLPIVVSCAAEQPETTITAAIISRKRTKIFLTGNSPVFTVPASPSSSPPPVRRFCRPTGLLRQQWGFRPPAHPRPSLPGFGQSPAGWYPQ